MVFGSRCSKDAFFFGVFFDFEMIRWRLWRANEMGFQRGLVGVSIHRVRSDGKNGGRGSAHRAEDDFGDGFVGSRIFPLHRPQADMLFPLAAVGIDSSNKWPSATA